MWQMNNSKLVRGTPLTCSTVKTDSVPFSSDHTATLSRGLFYSFRDNKPTPKQIVLVPNLVHQRTLEKKGYALILNQYQFTVEKLENRNGTQCDVAELIKVFRYFNIELNVKNDLKLSEIRQEIDKLTKKDFSKYECLIVVILTHGHVDHLVYAKDDCYNFVTEIEDVLSIKNETLHDKRKIFVIQACRGNGWMPVIEIDFAPIYNSDIESKPKIVKRCITQEGNVLQNNKPKPQLAVAKRNILKCFATYEGNVSFRHPELGTKFIQTFCEKLKEMETEPIYKIMMRVIDEVSDDPIYPQVPIIASKKFEPFCFGNLIRG